MHQAVNERDTIEDRDVLVQVEAVSHALRRLGHAATALPCTLNLESMLSQVRAMQPDLVFNLVESLGGADSLIYLTHAVLDAAGVPYCGNRTESHFLTALKLLAKERLQAAGLPTPPWIAENIESRWRGSCTAAPLMGDNTTVNLTADHSSDTWIVKGVWDQASRDLDEEAIVIGSQDEVLRAVKARIRRTGRPSFAEKFIAGREFNVGLLIGCDGVEVLPPAEIDFSDFPPEKPRIVGHRAKWDEQSFEYHHTPRTFDFPESDSTLLGELRSLSKKCWALFSLRGWARVDFRVDAAGRPWILEVNTNPCLSPDAGFYAALARAEIPFEQAIRRIVEEGMRGEGRGERGEGRE
ncbi:MAG: D-alanine--D-alanine ligase [Pirellulales bacterium]|nr:D-alanine--D-alanine ligase [Pirellulales bacterium]